MNGSRSKCNFITKQLKRTPKCDTPNMWNDMITWWERTLTRGREAEGKRKKLRAWEEVTLPRFVDTKQTLPWSKRIMRWKMKLNKINCIDLKHIFNMVCNCVLSWCNSISVLLFLFKALDDLQVLNSRKYATIMLLSPYHFSFQYSCKLNVPPVPLWIR